MNRKEILTKASQIVNGNREESYGSPEDNFQRIAAMWSSYLDAPVTPTDVSVMMILLKAARIGSGQVTLDNWIDIAGYAACGGEIQTGANDEEVMKWE